MNNFKKLRARWTRRLFLAVSLALGLVLGSGVAYGYWNVTGQRNLVGATLTSGTFDLTVGPSGGLAGTSNAYTLTMSDVSNLFPGESVAQSIVVNNASTGDAFMDITLSNFTVGSTSFGSYLTVTAYPFGSAPANTSGAVGSRQQTCGSATALGPTDSSTATSVAAGRSTSFCVLVSLATGTPSSFSGTSAAVPISFTLSSRQTPQ